MTLKELERRVRLLCGNDPDPITVCFMDGTHKEIPFYEALRLCCDDANVIDAITGDSTCTSLFRAIIDADKDFENIPELEEIGNL